MRSYHANLGGGIEGLAIREHEVPGPGPGEVLVRVRARSLNFRELEILRGWYPLPIKPDVVPVSDGAGEVVAVGEGVSRVALGDRVTGSIFPRWVDGPHRRENSAQLGGSLDGMLTEYALLPEEALARVPITSRSKRPPACPARGMTGWNALTGGRSLRAGETVLTLGSGGVSLFALHFAKVAGTTVIATTGSEKKADRLPRLGVDAVVDYRAGAAWPEQVHTPSVAARSSSR